MMTLVMMNDDDNDVRDNNDVDDDKVYCDVWRRGQRIDR